MKNLSAGLVVFIICILLSIALWFSGNRSLKEEAKYLNTDYHSRITGSVMYE